MRKDDVEMAGAKDHGSFKACHWSRRYLGAFLAVVLTLALFPVFGNAAPPEGTVPRADEPAQQGQDAPTANAKPYVIKEKELVFLLHGIGKGAYDMAALAKRINNAGYAVLNWDYPSTDHALAELADKLAVQVARFPEYKIHFVTHSMGGIVVRTYLSKYGVQNVGRLVMIAPPQPGCRTGRVLLRMAHL